MKFTNPSRAPSSTSATNVSEMSLRWNGATREQEGEEEQEPDGLHRDRRGDPFYDGYRYQPVTPRYSGEDTYHNQRSYDSFHPNDPSPRFTEPRHRKAAPWVSYKNEYNYHQPFAEESPTPTCYNEPAHGMISRQYAYQTERDYHHNNMEESSETVPGLAESESGSSFESSWDEKYFSPNHVPPVARLSDSKQQLEDKKIIEVSPGEYLRFRGADETWRAIEQDFYMPCECCCCVLTIFCIQDADFVLCPECRVVSPMADGALCGEGGVGLGFKMEDLARWQEDIKMRRKLARKK